MLEHLWEMCLSCDVQCCAGRSGAIVTGIFEFEDLDEIIPLRPSEQRFCSREIAYVDGSCPCFDGNLCIAHDYRPLVCRAYPFFPYAGRYVVNQNCPISREVNLISRKRVELRAELDEYFKELTDVRGISALMTIPMEWEVRVYV